VRRGRFWALRAHMRTEIGSDARHLICIKAKLGRGDKVTVFFSRGTRHGRRCLAMSASPKGEFVRPAGGGGGERGLAADGRGATRASTQAQTNRTAGSPRLPLPSGDLLGAGPSAGTGFAPLGRQRPRKRLRPLVVGRVQSTPGESFCRYHPLLIEREHALAVLMHRSRRDAVDFPFCGGCATHFVGSGRKPRDQSGRQCQ